MRLVHAEKYSGNADQVCDQVCTVPYNRAGVIPYLWSLSKNLSTYQPEIANVCSFGYICLIWNDTEKISMVLTQRWRA